MAPSKSVFREPPLTTAINFATAEAISRALRDLEAGSFTLAAQLVDSMGRDDRVKGTLRTRVNGLLGTALEFEPRGDGRRGKATANDVEKWFWKAFPEHALADLLKWGLQLGVGVGELIWTRGPRHWSVALKVWHPRHLTFNWETRTYWLTTLDGLIEVTPGDGKWVLFTPYGFERGWMEGLVRALAIPWLVRQWTRRDWSRYSEVHGQPTKKATVPLDASDKDKLQFLSDLQQLGSEGVAIVPRGPSRDGHETGYDLTLVEATAATWEGFERLLDKAETDIAVCVLGQNLTTEVKQGSRAAAQVHDDVRLDLKKYDAESLSTCVHDQALAPWAQFNLGDPDLAPYPLWRVDPPADLKTDAEALNVLGDALGKLKTAGFNVDLVRVSEKHSIPLVKGQPILDPEPEPEPREDATTEELAAREDQPRGMVEGQAYADAVADAARDAAAKVLEPDVDELLAAIGQAKDFDELRGTLVKLYAAMDPTALADLTKDAAVLAHLAGRRSQQLDL